MDDHWDEHTRTFELSDARVVAILRDGGGAVVENVPVLEVHEGRMESYGTDGAGQSTSTLDYGLMFNPKGAAGERQTGFNAAIVITGTVKPGRVMEIRGDGFIGQDETGTLDGVFHEVPAMYVPDDDDMKAHVEREQGKWAFTPKGEFVMATYGHAQDWS